jgi:two-component system sensor histidine kinase VicK
MHDTNRATDTSELANVCDSIPQGIVLLDKNAKVIYLNGAASLYLGERSQEILHERIDDLLPDQELRDAAIAVAAGLKKRTATLEIDRRKDGAGGILRFTVRAVARQHFSGAAIFIEDVTQQYVAAESRDTFIDKVTHEFRTPLTNIMLALESAMEADDDDSARRAECLNVIGHEARRLERVVQDMLSVAEMEAGTHELRRDDVAVDELLRDVKANFAGMASEKQITLELSLPPKIPVIQADRDKIMVALQNLVGNAVKYTGENGHVTIAANVTDEQIEVVVSDSGIGIDRTDLDRIFERFYRGSDRRVSGIVGSGLGLTIAREVVRLHGGEITVESERDRGSTFTLVLPSLRAAA